jgi:anti-sigma factor RsiW
MDCNKAKNLIADYSVDLLSAETKKDMESHLAECESCAAEFEKLKSVMLLVENLPEMEPSDTMWSNIHSIITADRKPVSFLQRLTDLLNTSKLRWSLCAAAVILVFMMLISIFNKPADNSVSIASDNSAYYMQEHLIYSSTDLFSDMAANNFKAALINTNNESLQQ